LSYNKIGFDEAVALIDTKDKDKSSQKKQNVDESELINIYEPILSTVGELQHIRIIDLSFNFLRSISPDFAKFPELHTLQLHKNLIFKLDEVLNLCNCSELRTLTLHNNPIEEVPGYRTLVCSKLPMLKKLDSLVVTRVEIDAINNQKRIKPTGPTDIKKKVPEVFDSLWSNCDTSAKKMMPNLREVLEN